MAKSFKHNLLFLFTVIMHVLNERQRRLICGALALFFGTDSHSVKLIHENAGISKSTVYKGIQEIEAMWEEYERTGVFPEGVEAIPRPEVPLDPSQTDSAAPDEALPKSNVLKPRRRLRPRGRKPKDQKAKKAKEKKRIRKNVNGKVGRPTFIEKYNNAACTIQRIIDDYYYGNPMDDLKWVTLSLRNIQKQLDARYGWEISRPTIAKILRLMGYTLQQNRKNNPVVKQHPDRDNQFKYMRIIRDKSWRRGIMVLSLDEKMKEKIGDMARKGAEWCPVGEPLEVDDHDFLDPDKGIIIPYGIYDCVLNKGFVVLGRSKDTGEFAVNCLRTYLTTIAPVDHPGCKELLILCDGGGSNGSRCRLWKKCLCELATELGLTITVMHFPPGTSKWNPIEHRLFSFISMNWRARPLFTVGHAVHYISSTFTETGLTVSCVVDETEYETGKRISDKEMKALEKTYIQRHETCPQWNYTIYGSGKPASEDTANEDVA